MISRLRFIAPFSLLLMLAACGGDAGSTAADGSSSGSAAGSGGSGGSSGSGGSGGSGAAATAVIYESAPNPANAADLLTQLDAEGATGHDWDGPAAFTGDLGAISTIYAKSNTETYTYEVLPQPATFADRLTQANAEGARGFARVTPYMISITVNGVTSPAMIYRHVVGSNAVYSYESLAAPTTDAEFLTQANAEGARGYLLVVVDGAQGNNWAALYGKDSTSTAVYAYANQPQTTSPAAFLAQANAQGAQGYRYLNAAAFIGQTSAVYVKDTTQSASFVFSEQPAITQTSDYVAQANTQGANGLRLVGELQFGSTPQVFYFLPQNCTGVLCTPWGNL